MPQCKFCGQWISGGCLTPVWDKHVRAYVNHYVCWKCLPRAEECYRQAREIDRLTGRK